MLYTSIMNRTVTLTDAQGNALGLADIIDAHTGEGKLHRAFSVYVFRKDRQEILIQKRSSKKMLWPGIWANTCCSHPFENEGSSEAGQRRLREELGFEAPLKEEGTLVYRALDPFGKGVEHEHVTLLVSDAGENIEVVPNPDEVAEYAWRNVEELQNEMAEHPDHFAPWFHLGLTQLLQRS